MGGSYLNEASDPLMVTAFFADMFFVRKKMEKVILKFNAVVGKNHLPEIEEITKRLSLNIEDVREENPIPGKKLKVILVAGSKESVALLHEEMHRFPSVTAKPFKN